MATPKTTTKTTKTKKTSLSSESTAKMRPGPTKSGSMVLKPLDGFQGVVALRKRAQVGAGDPVWDVAVFVDQAAAGSVTWTPNSPEDIIVDVPSGFNIANGDVLLAIVSTPSAGKPPPGSVTGHP